MSGPYETERQAAADVRHITGSPDEAWRDGSHRLLEEACTGGGVRLGAFDHRILLWLAGWEPATCAVIAGLITRAHAGDVPAADLDTLADQLEARLGNECADRQAIAEDAIDALRRLGGAR